MKIVYVHGLDSSANSVKGKLLADYCQKNHPELKVVRPDFNQTPDKVFDSLCGYVQSEYDQSEHDKVTKSFDNQTNLNSIDPLNQHKVVLLGSSLGGYFASLVSNATGCPAVLLNPSTRPHLSLQRFVDETMVDMDNCDESRETVVYRTTGGWSITLKDLDWFSNHKLEKISYPNIVFALIKAGDELLDPVIATDFYKSQGVEVALQSGGDHRMTDFQNQLPMIMKKINNLKTNF